MGKRKTPGHVLFGHFGCWIHAELLFPLEATSPKNLKELHQSGAWKARFLMYFMMYFIVQETLHPWGASFFFGGDTQQNVAFTYKLKSTKSLTSNDKW